MGIKQLDAFFVCFPGLKKSEAQVITHSKINFRLLIKASKH